MSEPYARPQAAELARRLAEARAELALWGRLVESAVGAHLVNAAAGGACELFYWRDRGVEVDSSCAPAGA
jgi:hypothetical protein